MLVLRELIVVDTVFFFGNLDGLVECLGEEAVSLNVLGAGVELGTFADGKLCGEVLDAYITEKYVFHGGTH